MSEAERGCLFCLDALEDVAINARREADPRAVVVLLEEIAHYANTLAQELRK